MSTTIDIPGGSATLRDPSDMRERHRRMIQAYGLPLASVYQRLPEDVRERAAGKGKDADAARQQVAFLFPGCIKTAEEGAAFLAARDATVIALLESWTLPRPLPTLETLPDLEPQLYDALVSAVQPLQEQVNEAVRPRDFGVNPVGTSPFGSSGASNGRSRGARATRQTPTRRSSGVSSASAVSTKD